MRAQWSSFREFVETREDAITRSYNLMAYGPTPNLVRHAVVSLGYTGTNPFSQTENDIIARLASEAVELAPQYHHASLRDTLVRWYAWHRIKHGYVRRWPTLSSKDCGRRKTPLD